MVDRIDPIEEANRKRRSTEVSDSARAAIMQAAMNKNPSMNQEANNDMANVSQGTTAISDISRQNTAVMDNQEIYATGDSSRIQEAKASGLAVGTRIEEPDSPERQQKTERLLTSSTDQLALYNRIDLFNKKKTPV